MRCPKCFAEFAPGSSACPKCGNALAESQQSTPAPTSSRPKWVFPVAGGLVAVLLLALVAAWAMKGKSATNASEKPVSGPSVTNAPVMPAGGSSVTNAPNIPGGPVTTPQVPSKGAPQDVLDYLNFAKGIEAQRQTLLRDTSRAVTMSQSKGLSTMIDWAMDDSSSTPADPLAEVKKELSGQVTNWQSLLKQFEAKPSPQSCSEFATAYRQGLTSETSAMDRIVGIMNGINMTSSDSMQGALSSLNQMKAENVQGNIDTAVQTADTKLGELCSRYGIAKPFDVKKESDSGGSLTGGL